jgi:hypothetical protein
MSGSGKSVNLNLDLGSGPVQVRTIISEKAPESKGLIRPYIPDKPFKLSKCIVMIVCDYSGPLFNLKAI